ncbi:MAG: hypothetical protein L3J07_02500 [Candidatus Magasanikbacteria bacterium]|nr:hypothetical protein [Candidatus Magasanikbacteria bacterium]
MKERKKKLLKLIIENYIKTVEPVGSKFLANSGSLDVSAPTVRNEMRELESEGFLTHPHTSAGRIPTEKGYKFYVENIIKPVGIGEFKEVLEKSEIVNFEGCDRVKKIAQEVAEFLNNAVFVAFNSNSVYYTGISNLFSQPEFKNHINTLNTSVMFDKCEEIVYNLLGKIEQNKTSVLIGRENPLGSSCSSIIARFGEEGLFILIGPTRMDYEKNIAILKFLISKL